MSAGRQSLRSAIDKWGALGFEGNVRLTRPSHGQSGVRRCVRVEAAHAGAALTVFFFLHEDGSWRVFPPTLRRPMFKTG